jgi:hypothetical protein
LLRHKVLLSLLFLGPEWSQHLRRHLTLLISIIHHAVLKLHGLLLLLHLLQAAASIRRVELIEQTELHLLHTLEPLDDDSLSIVYLLQLTDLLELFILPKVLVSHLVLNSV